MTDVNTKAAANPKKPYAATKLERFFYSNYFIGQNVVFIITTTFLSIYYTNVLGIPATIVGTILLLARVWDAVFDPLLATLVENARFRSGKFKPWIQFAAFSVPVLTVLCFGFGDQLIHAGQTVRVIYATATYLIWGTIYAASDAPSYALATAMTPYPEERNILLSYNQLTGMIGMLVGMLTFPSVLGALGNNYFITVAIYSVFSCVFMFLARFTKERVKHEDRSPSVIEIFKAIGTNKYMVVLIIVLTFMWGSKFASILIPFVALDVYHNPEATAALMGVTLIPYVIVGPLVPALIRKFGKIKLLSFSLFITIIFSVIKYFTCFDNYGLMLILTGLGALLSAPMMFIYSLFFADCMEYDCYTTGRRFEAATFAAQTFMVKLTMAISGGLGMWIIGLAGYKEAVEGQAVTQTSQAIHALWAATNLAPAIGCLFAVVIFLKFYHLTEEKVKMMVGENMKRTSLSADNSEV